MGRMVLPFCQIFPSLSLNLSILSHSTTCINRLNALNANKSKFYSTSPLPSSPVSSPSLSPSLHSPSPPSSLQEQLHSTFISEGNKFKTCLAKEIETIKQAKQDKDLVDDFLALHKFKVSPHNSSVLMKVVDGEEIKIDFNHDKKRDKILCHELPEALVFEAIISKKNTIMTFLCQRDYRESGDKYEITSIRVREDKEEITMLAQHLQESTIDTYKSFLYSRVPPSTPQLIDTLLNMRADKEYLTFLNLASKLFTT